jgi:hypothetical protein
MEDKIMKMNIFKCLTFGLFAVSSLFFVSCDRGVEDGDIVIDGSSQNLIYFSVNSANTLSYAVVHTPVGDFGNFEAKFPVKIQRATTQATTVNVAVDNSLVDTYNKAHNTEYVPVPDGVIDMSKAVAHIKVDTIASYDSVSVVLPESALSKLTEKGYLLPLKISDVSGEGTGSVERGIMYVIITTSTSLINDSPTGLLGTKADGSNWKCLSADGLDANAFATENWSFTKKQATSSFVVDLGATHKVSGYLVGSDLINNGEIAVSEDNSTWTTLGSLRGHKGIDEEIGWSTYTWYVLYGAVPARYVKVTMDLNTGYWGWNYIQWGYCTIDKFGLTYND